MLARSWLGSSREKRDRSRRNPPKNNPMPTVAANTYRLPVPEKLVKGRIILDLGADNPGVPGNAAVLAAFAAAQEELAAATADLVVAQQEVAQRLAARDAALQKWNAAMNSLSAFTESATGGDPSKVLSAGFDVRAGRTPSQPVPQIRNVRVSFASRPGYSEVRWQPDENADAYMLQRCADLKPGTTWEDIGVATKSKYEGNGATPGQPYWYRVAGVNTLGQGPWSEPALRPVM